MVPLAESVSATADANGRAVARLTPLRAFERWHITNISVSSSSTLTSRTDLYINGESASNFHSGTYSGNRDSNDTPVDLENGTPLIAVWSGCTAGSACTLTVRGQKVKE